MPWAMPWHDHEDHQAQVGDDSVNGLVAHAKETEEDVVVNDGEKAQHKFDGAVSHPQGEDAQENLGVELKLAELHV